MIKRNLAFFCCAISFFAPVTRAAAAITMDTVAVGNPGNPSDPFDGNGNISGAQHLGRVDYSYRIGTYEVTNDQYAAFLNAKASSDPLGLYNPKMGSRDWQGGIARSGTSGSFTYAPLTNMGDKPVGFVSWYDSTRFINWLQNGQGNGDTETGAYTILGGTATPSNGDAIVRNSGAQWFLPTETEWYKAAYHQPTAQGGDVDQYWHYATRSNIAPSQATANSLGGISNPGINVANYDQGAEWDDNKRNVTTVGSAGPLSASFYGTFDQGGNVWELTENFFANHNRTMRGGSWFGASTTMRSSEASAFPAENESENVGFRVGTFITPVPEPSALALAALGFAGLAGWGWRRRGGQ